MPNIYLDRGECNTLQTCQAVTVDEQGKGFGRRVVCRNGRILGENRTYAIAHIDGACNYMTADECRALAASLLVAADVLEGKQEAPEIIREREERKAAQTRGEAERAERDRRLAEEGVEIVCTACGESKRVLPEKVGDWLKSTPYCCRKRNRRYAAAAAK